MSGGVVQSSAESVVVLRGRARSELEGSHDTCFPRRREVPAVLGTPSLRPHIAWLASEGKSIST